MSCEDLRSIVKRDGRAWADDLEFDEINPETQEIIGPLDLNDFIITAAVTHGGSGNGAVINLDINDGLEILATSTLRITLSGARLAPMAVGDPVRIDVTLTNAAGVVYSETVMTYIVKVG